MIPIRAIAIGAIGAIGLVCLLFAGLSAQAQEAEPDTQAQALLEQGIKSQTSGQHRLAVQTITRALGAEGLAPNDVAKGLYYRGLAYKEIGRPEQAIADLTGALFLSGLSDKERATAEQARTASFSAGGAGAVAAVAAAGRAGDAPPPASSAPAFATRVDTPAASPQQPAPPVFSTSVAREAPPPEPRERVASAPPPPPTSFSTRVDVAPRAPPPPLRTTIRPAEPDRPAPPPTPAPAPAQAPSWSTSVGGAAPPPQTAETESGGSRLGRFFGNIADNITGESGASGTAEPSSAPATSWVQTTRVDPSGRQQSAAVQPAPSPPASAPAPAPQPTPSAGGGYRIQVAALPSEEEAQASWKRLSGKHKAVLGGKQPIIQRTDLGTLGVFYRVQLGPYADQTESQRLCNDFKRSGLDCFVTAQ